MPSASPAAQARRLFFSHLNNNTSSHSLFSVPLSLFLQIPTRRSRRAGGGALRLARLGGIFALGLAAKVGASVYTPIRGASSSAASAASAAASGGVKGLFADPELEHRDADYAHFAELLGTVMLMREGGEGVFFLVLVLFLLFSSGEREREREREEEEEEQGGEETAGGKEKINLFFTPPSFLLNPSPTY